VYIYIYICILFRIIQFVVKRKKKLKLLTKFEPYIRIVFVLDWLLRIVDLHNLP
jgi:hypothetical protein